MKIMNLNEKYRIHNKSRSNKILWIYLLIALFFIFSWSLAKYISNSNVTFIAGVAKWNIKVNGIEITQSTTKIKNEMELVVTENENSEGLIKPGQKGYFDIEIDPQYTEVSLKYKINIDTSNLPEGIKITEYSINEKEERIELPENKKIEGEISLAGKNNLEKTDTKKYRIYWTWDKNDAKPEDFKGDYKVRANLQIEQIL